MSSAGATNPVSTSLRVASSSQGCCSMFRAICARRSAEASSIQWTSSNTRSAGAGNRPASSSVATSSRRCRRKRGSRLATSTRLGQLDVEEGADEREPRREPGGEPCCAPTEALRDSRRRLLAARSDDGPHRTAERVVGGRRLVLLASSREDDDVRGLRAELLDEPRLPDSRLADQLDDTAPAGSREPDRLEKRGHLLLAPDQTCGAAAHRSPYGCPHVECGHRVGLALEHERPDRCRQKLSSASGRARPLSRAAGPPLPCP